jgi:hypothetical protein
MSARTLPEVIYAAITTVVYALIYNENFLSLNLVITAQTVQTELRLLLITQDDE